MRVFIKKYIKARGGLAALFENEKGTLAMMAEASAKQTSKIVWSKFFKDAYWKAKGEINPYSNERGFRVELTPHDRTSFLFDHRPDNKIRYGWNIKIQEFGYGGVFRAEVEVSFKTIADVKKICANAVEAALKLSQEDAAKKGKNLVKTT